MGIETSSNLKKGTLNNLNFSIDLLEKDQVPNYYSKMFNIESNALIHSNGHAQSRLSKGTFLLIDEVPNYLHLEINDQQKGIRVKKINTYKGSMINLGAYTDLNGYLGTEVSKKRKANINRCQRRLDLCFKPEYKMFYGNISRSDYDEIFHAYKQMLKRRLAQKQSYWEELDYWEERYSETYDLVLSKKACIYAIYSDNRPIAIYINSVFEKTLYIDVVAYDIDYSKFKLGFLTLTKVIEWAILNQFDLIDMSKGDFYYKERFRNREYTFQKHIIYDSKNWLVSRKAYFLWFKLSVIYNALPLLKKWKIDKLYKAFTDKRKKDFLKEFKPSLNALHVEKRKEIGVVNQLEPISLGNDQYSFLRKTFMDFLFDSFEYIGNTAIYRSKIEKGTYFFKGEKEVSMVTQMDRLNHD